MNRILSRHYLAILASLMVGVIYAWPHFLFIVSNRDVNQGIPLMQAANEDFYLARMQEIVDGHPLLGSTPYFEYKNQPPIQPPTNELLYALPTLAFGVPLVATLTAGKFILPIGLFLLVYFFVYRLLGGEEDRPRRFTALAAVLLITLGYDLIDYRTVFGYLRGTAAPSSFLVWTRPVNPIMGALLLFAFLHCLWSIIENTKRLKSSIFGAGVFLALMFASYFFSWGLALSIMAMLGLFYLLKRNYAIVGRFILIFLIGLLFSSPYWYLSIQARSSPWYEASLLRSGMFYTHHPILNKVLLAALAIYVVYLAIKFFRARGSRVLEAKDLFILAWLVGGMWAFNQQIITGLTVWPFHFVQYTIPLSIIALLVVLHHLSSEQKILRAAMISIFIVASIGFGIFVQYKTYEGSLAHNRQIQSYAKVFAWFNRQSNDCTMFLNIDQHRLIEFSGLILAFTHCNLYSSNWSYSLMPYERNRHSFLVNLRFRGIAPEEIEKYLEDNKAEMRNYLFSNWAGLYEETRFPDFDDPQLAERTEHFPDEYREFLSQNLETELDKYRLDFILSFGPLLNEVADQLPHAELREEIDGLYIYQYRNKS